MTEYQGWFQERQVERTLKALRKNHFDAEWIPKSSDAAGEIFQRIPEGTTVGIGGSLTLSQIGFFEEAKKHPIKLLHPFAPGLSPEQGLQIRREILLADVFVTGTNAVTEDGKLINIDGTGNRVAAMIFGPKKVIVVCGINKIVKDLTEAQRRAQEWAAPMNARRLGVKTPCAETGLCADCDSPQRICNIYTILAKRPVRTEFAILLVGEPLGF
ncbi:MAG: lactate utilization protein [candidate division NC10 bacterium]|nr:lactate utilization protein [candidate division NC10 bacterium]